VWGQQARKLVWFLMTCSWCLYSVLILIVGNDEKVWEWTIENLPPTGLMALDQISNDTGVKTEFSHQLPVFQWYKVDERKDRATRVAAFRTIGCNPLGQNFVLYDTDAAPKKNCAKHSFLFRH
jgi:hypothetical protein